MLFFVVLPKLIRIIRLLPPRSDLFRLVRVSVNRGLRTSSVAIIVSLASPGKLEPSWEARTLLANSELLDAVELACTFWA